MTKSGKDEQVMSLVKEVLNNFRERNEPEDVALSAGAVLFSSLARELNLSAEQFLYLCEGIAKKTEWKKQEEESNV